MKLTNLPILTGLMLSLGSVGFAIFLQFYYELTPCPLCIFSRIILIGLGLIYAAWLVQRLIFKKQIDLIYFCFITVGVVSGLALSGYHNWLMHLPSEKIPACGPDLTYLLENLPFNEAVIEAFKGSGSCAQDAWRLFGLTVAQLEIGVYLSLAALQLYVGKKLKAMRKTRGV